MNSVSKYIELLIQMLEIPSLSRQESERADFLQDWLLKEGFCLQRKANNLVITKGHDPQQTRIMLNSHLDTVPPAEGWHTDPFVPDFKNNRVTGLGSNDAGGSVVSMIAAYSNLVEMGLADTAVLVISAEEEVSGVNGLSMVIPDLPNLQLAIVGEPTSLQPAVAERGLMVVDARANGTAGHAARNEGDNAIYKAMADIDAICQMIFTKRSKWLNPPSVNVTMIRAGTGHNIVPASCEFVIDVRSNDCYTNEELLDIFRAKCQSELIPRSTRLKSSFLSEEHFLFEVLADLQLKPFGSPTLSDMALLEVPAIKIGPGESSRSHTANEYIGHKEISAAIGLYTLLLEKTIKRLQ
jgi:acetylornithine deacetylase